MFLQQTFCYQVLFKCGSSALLLLVLLMRRRNICLCHGDLFIHSIHGKQGFVAIMSLSEILAGFFITCIHRIDNSLTLGFPEKKIQMYSLPGYLPNLLSPFDFIFFFLTLLCNFWSPFWDKSSLGHPVTHPVFPGRILLNKHWRWDTPTYPPEMQGE